ncbi:MAG TPA: NAD(+) diphosphatase [Mycobacteriales bacterium]|nr:NAD(+) diphosphatase [Mycobacteriales bacterium]
MTADDWGRTRPELADPDAPPVLARATVDRAAQHRGDAAWLRAAWDAGRVRLLRVGPDLGVRSTHDGAGAHLAWEEPLPWQKPPDGLMLLGDDGRHVYVASPDGEPGGASLRDIGAQLDDAEAGLLTTAFALAAWHASHTHCPRCGTPTEVVQSGWATRCPRDGSDHFPRTDPAVIMLVHSPSGERAVLGRQPSWPANRYSCLAGFVEAGESAEQCVVREVREEAGIDVHDVRPVASQPWPFPRSLMLGFRAVADDDAVPNGADAELEDVRWFTKEDVLSGRILLPPPVSIANRLISAWLADRL